MTFPLAAAEDRDLCDRWRARDFAMDFVADAVVRHSHPLTLTGFCHQHCNYGPGACHFHDVRARRNQAPIHIEPPLCYRNMVAQPLKLTRTRAVPLASLLVLSQAANALGFFYERLVSER